MANIQSDKIKIFPGTHRSDAIDRAARLTTEKNLTNIINRLTDIKSFIISAGALDVSIDGTELTISGSYNVGGYYIELKECLINVGANTHVWLKLTLDDTASDYSYAKVADTVNNSTSYIEGIELVADTSAAHTTTSDTLYLCIAQKVDDTWEVPKNEDLKFDINHIKISGDITGLSKTSESSYSNNLYDFLVNDFVIDDGEL